MLLLSPVFTTHKVQILSDYLSHSANKVIKLKVIMLLQNPSTLSMPHVTGDKYFHNKFRGRSSVHLGVERMKLLKAPALSLNHKGSKGTTSQNMLPKLKQLQRIAKTDRRKPPKLNKYLDGFSDLDIYMTNKLMKNQSTRQIVSHLTQNIDNQNILRQVVDNNYMRMTVSGAQNRTEKPRKESLEKEGLRAMMAQTDYATSKKWVSDRELVQKFDQFISIGQDGEESLRQSMRPEPRLTSEDAVLRISSDKEYITKVAKRMIAESNNYTEQEDIEQNKLIPQKKIIQEPEAKNIDWILRACSDYDKKFSIRKKKAKSHKL